MTHAFISTQLNEGLDTQTSYELGAYWLVLQYLSLHHLKKLFMENYGNISQ